MASGIQWDDEPAATGVQWDAPALPDYLKKARRAANGLLEVDTPQGPARFTADGRPIISPEEAQGRIDAERARFKENALSMALSAIHGASNSLTSKAAGVKRAIEGQPLGLLGAALHPSQALADYDKGQTDAARTVDEAVEQHPAANILGALAMPTPGPGKMKAGGSVLVKALEHAAPAAEVGLLNAFGGTKASDSARDVLAKTATGTGIGGLFGGTIGASGGALAKANGVMRRIAEDRAVNAMTQRGISNKLEKAGLRTADQARALARWMLDNGVVRFGDSAEHIANRAEELIDKEGERIGDVLGRADATGKVPDFVEAGTKVLDSLNDETGVALQGRKVVDDLAEALASEQKPSFRQLWQAKHDAQDMVNWGAQPKGAGRLLRNATSALRENTYDQLGRVLTGADAKAIADSANTFGKAKTVLKLAGDKATREAASYKPSLSTQMLAERVAEGLGGGRVGHAVGEGVVTAGKFLERRGDAMKAASADMLASVLGATPATLDRLAGSHDAASEAIKVAAWLKALRQRPDEH